MASNRVPPVGGTTASTSSAGIVQLTDSTSSTSTTTAATPNSVKSAYDLANGAIAKTLTTTTGDIIYASSANTPARLGIGSAGQVLSVSSGIPAWTTPSSGGWTLLSTTNLSGSTVVVDVVSTGYRQLSVWVVNYNPTGSGYPNWRINGDSGANYRYNGVYSSDATHAVSGATDTNNIPVSIGGAMQSGGDIKAIGIFTIWNPDSTTSHKPFTYIERCGGQSGEKRFWNIAGAWGNLSAVTSVHFAPGGGSTWQGGQILVYGVK